MFTKVKISYSLLKLKLFESEKKKMNLKRILFFFIKIGAAGVLSIFLWFVLNSLFFGFFRNSIVVL